MEKRLDLPSLIQAPMAGATNSLMVIEVCRAGGLGSIPAAMLTPDALAKEIANIQAHTAAPFNVNFFTHVLTPLDKERQQQWRQLLQVYFTELGIDTREIPEVAQRLPFTQAQLEILQQYRPSVVSFHFGIPDEKLLQGVKDTGAKVFSSATTVAEAIHLADRGVDAVIAQGNEAGGHRGMFLDVPPGCTENVADVSAQLGTFVLLPQVVEALEKYNIPVIAAGGLAGGNTFKAARVLGASAVQLGTAYLLCPESTIGSLHRAALLQVKKNPKQAKMALTNVFTGKPARGLVNRLMRDLRYIHPLVTEFPHPSQEIAALRSVAEAQGLSDFTPLWCGQNLSASQEIPAYILTQQLLAQWSAS